MYVTTDKSSLQGNFVREHNRGVAGSGHRMSSGNSDEKEVYAFLAMPLVAKEECPFKWWSAQKSAFQNIDKVAKKFLSAPTQNAYSVKLVTSCMKKEVGSICEKVKAFCSCTIICQD